MVLINSRLFWCSTFFYSIFFSSKQIFERLFIKTEPFLTFLSNYRSSDGKPIANAAIDVSSDHNPNGRRHIIRSSKEGDYFRLLVPGDYKITVTVGVKSITVPVHVNGVPAVVVNFVVGDDTITAQSVHPNARGTGGKKSNTIAAGQDVIPQVIGDDNNFNMQESLHNNEIKKDASSPQMSAKNKKVSRTDNIAAAAVIVTIGAIVCVVAGVMLFRKVKEMKHNEKSGGYAKINQEKLDFDP